MRRISPSSRRCTSGTYARHQAHHLRDRGGARQRRHLRQWGGRASRAYRGPGNHRDLSFGGARRGCAASSWCGSMRKTASPALSPRWPGRRPRPRAGNPRLTSLRCIFASSRAADGLSISAAIITRHFAKFLSSTIPIAISFDRSASLRGEGRNNPGGHEFERCIAIPGSPRPSRRPRDDGERAGAVRTFDGRYKMLNVLRQLRSARAACRVMRGTLRRSGLSRCRSA